MKMKKVLKAMVAATALCLYADCATQYSCGRTDGWSGG